MPLMQFIKKKFRPRTRALIEKANEIIEEYQAAGYSLTLRQLYYQFVARDLLPNTERSYKALGSAISDARMAGLIDWEAIEDRTRNLERNPHWESPAQIVQLAAEQFAIDKWADQAHRVEVWIEKQALTGVIEGTCSELDVPFFACRGYVSQSEQWRAGMRFRRYRQEGQRPVVLHLGDHDPSGIDMTRDNADRLGLFNSLGVEVRRIALNMDQIEEYGPPPNPAKVTDARFERYSEEYGGSSWELDALEPQVISDLVTEHVLALRDDDPWNDALSREENMRDELAQIADDLDATDEEEN